MGVLSFANVLEMSPMPAASFSKSTIEDGAIASAGFLFQRFLSNKSQDSTVDTYDIPHTAYHVY